MAHLAVNGGNPVRNKPFPVWPEVTAEDEQAMLAVTRSAKWGRYLGDRVKTFEEKFARLTGAKYCVAVANGTLALETAI